MAPGRLEEAWSKYGTQMLVLMSLVLQLLLFILPIVRRHKMLEKRKYLERLFKLLLWLAYQLVDPTAVCALGAMAISSISSQLSREERALWACVLLWHLGGQDTMSAYSLEDNRLWQRRLSTVLVETGGLLYVLDGLGRAGGGSSSGPYPRLRAASTLMFVVGLFKVAERIWVLQASDMNKLFPRQGEDRQECYIAPHARDSSERAEEDLKQAHELLFFCVCQFVGYKDGLTQYQKGVIKHYAREKRLCELVHLQLSLMHDLLYTKAAAIHKWFGFLLRVVSWLATATTCTLVFLSGSSYGGRRLDAAVTYALLVGALLLETASSLRAVGSTWTYEILRSGGWCGLGRVVLAFRRLVRAAERSRRRCPGYIGGWESTNWGNTSLFVDEIEEMVTAYIEMDRVVDHREKKEEKLMNSRGGLSLPRLLLLSGRDEGKVKLIQDLEQLEFDEYYVLWYHATFKFTNSLPSSSEAFGPSSSIRRAVQELTRYMEYLFWKQPDMLPPPLRYETRTTLYLEYEKNSVYQKLEKELLGGTTQESERKLKPLLWVWIEMLCYAASHCNRESHAKELSNGSPEFATVLWMARAALFNANMEPAVSAVADASVRDESHVATEGISIDDTLP